MFWNALRAFRNALERFIPSLGPPDWGSLPPSYRTPGGSGGRSCSGAAEAAAQAAHGHQQFRAFARGCWQNGRRDWAFATLAPKAVALKKALASCGTGAIGQARALLAAASPGCPVAFNAAAGPAADGDWNGFEQALRRWNWGFPNGVVTDPAVTSKSQET